MCFRCALDVYKIQDGPLQDPCLQDYRFPFVMNVKLMELLIMPPYVNTQFTAGSSIAKLPDKVVPNSQKFTTV